jgi:hypothetical protein
VQPCVILSGDDVRDATVNLHLNAVILSGREPVIISFPSTSSSRSRRTQPDKAIDPGSVKKSRSEKPAYRSSDSKKIPLYSPYHVNLVIPVQNIPLLIPLIWKIW